MYAKVQRPEKLASSWEDRLRYLPECEWSVAESQRGMMGDESEIISQNTTPWKTCNFSERKGSGLYRRTSELLSRVPKRNGAEKSEISILIWLQRVIQWRRRVNYIYELYCWFITWWRKICLLMQSSSYKACIFIVFCQKKKRERKRVPPGWTDISGLGPLCFLSRSSMY